jgi:hypothetical protein
MTKWSKRDAAALIDMRDRRRMAWKVIAAAFPLRTLQACKVHYYQSKRPIAPCDIIWINQAPPTAPIGRTISTAALQLDNELVSRIAVLGITGGLLGDPLPGRSALDQKRAAGLL